MTSVPEVKLTAGEKIADKFTVKKKLGEGSCGQVYLLEDTRNANQLAMKVEPRMKQKDEEIIKMEIYVLKKLQTSKHVCRFVQSGCNDKYSFVIMTLLGQELSELRRRCPKRQMSHASVLRMAIQAVAAVEDMHKVGFIHRDIKPTNLAVGHKAKHAVFLFDFGLARQIMLPDSKGKLVLREPRKKVSFRGTVRYCSLNVHLAKEQGRHDDLWSILHSMIELATGTLPWKGTGRKEAERLKKTVTEKELLKGCPTPLRYLYKQLQNMTYTTTPDYKAIKAAIAKEIKNKGVTMTSPFEWEKDTKGGGGKGGEGSICRDAKREVDKSGEKDNDTSKDVDENAQSATSEISTNDSCDGADYDIEDTLENVGDVKDSYRELKDDKDKDKEKEK